MAAANKDRVYVALYGRGGLDPNTYHWAIIIGPEEEVEEGIGHRYHVKQQFDPTSPTQSKDAVAALEADGRSLGTRFTNWQDIEQYAKDYIGQKRQQNRYDSSGSFPEKTVPTFDLIEKKETVP
ncbi:hypothetical protein AJ78_03785 [Emergomyces pasteurianus Ep9510]|uniref:Uncharacterized protein n=1 Tax=Emergomyces pasteurianus Ep9510 TaxID=1447872 RepID=A0A1J9PHV5_9EURO|nr:hypothetical protein AJ78_03785 [Emergomyces pasteurianus Ep9510]